MTTTATKYKLSGWDLSELLSEPTETEISARVADIEEEVSTFEGLRSRLESATLAADELLVAVARYESIIRKSWTLGYYGICLLYTSIARSSVSSTRRTRLTRTSPTRSPWT